METPVSAIVHVCADTPMSAIERACGILTSESTLATMALSKLSGILSKESLVRLKRSLSGTAISSKELALALMSAAAGIETGKATPEIHLVWTGPDTPQSSQRDTLPQILEMIGRAKETILLVTFAAFKASSIMRALDSASKRGVKLTIVVEMVECSGGQLTQDASKAFPKSLIQAGSLWFWPLAHRPTNSKGLPGKLHAKCLVIDRREALVSSANLTDDAMERNIEVGIRCVSSQTARTITTKFATLIETGQLRRVECAP